MKNSDEQCEYKDRPCPGCGWSNCYGERAKDCEAYKAFKKLEEYEERERKSREGGMWGPIPDEWK